MYIGKFLPSQFLIICLFLTQIILPGCNGLTGSNSTDNNSDTRIIEIIEPEEAIQNIKLATSKLSGQMQYIDASLYLISMAFQALDGSGVGTSAEGGKLSITRIANGNVVFTFHEFIMGGKTYNSIDGSPLTLIPVDEGFQLSGKLTVSGPGLEYSLELEFDLNLDDQKIGRGNIICNGELTAIANYNFITGKFATPENENVEIAVPMNNGLNSIDSANVNIAFDESGQIHVDYSNLLKNSMTRPSAIFALTGDPGDATEIQKTFPDTGNDNSGDDSKEITAKFPWWWWLILLPPPPPQKEPDPPPIQTPAEQVDPGYSNTSGTRILLVGDSWTEQVVFKYNSNLLNNSLNNRGLGAYNSYGGAFKLSPDATAIAGTDAINFWSNSDLRKRIDQALSLFPAIDIVHLSLGGNDLVYGLLQNKSAFDQEFQNKIALAIENLIQYIHSLKPEIKINIVGYTNVRMEDYPFTTMEFFNLAVQSLEMKKAAIAKKYNYVYYTNNIGLYPNPPPESIIPNNAIYDPNIIAEDGFHLTKLAFQDLMNRCVELYYKFWLRGRQAPPAGGDPGNPIANIPPGFGNYQLMWPGGIEKIYYVNIMGVNFPVAVIAYLDVHLDYSDPDGYITTIWYYNWRNGWVIKTNNKVFRFKTIISWWNLHGSGGFTVAIFDNNYSFAEQHINFSW